MCLEPEENKDMISEENADINIEPPITKPRSKFEAKSTKITSSSINPARENVSPPKKGKKITHPSLNRDLLTL